MLKNNFLASTTIYVSIAHKQKILQKYYKILNQVFYRISKNDIIKRQGIKK